MPSRLPLLSLAALLASLVAGAPARAGDALADSPIDTCYAQAAARGDVAGCLARLLEEARRELVEAVTLTRRGLADFTPQAQRAAVQQRFERSQQLFWSYRLTHCEWLNLAAAPAADAAELHIDCMVRLTRARNAELRARLRAGR